MQLLRPEYGTGIRKLREVNPAVVQEVIDVLFGRQWLELVNDEYFEMKRRRWMAEIDRVPAPPPTISATSDDLTTKVRTLKESGASVSKIKEATGLTGEQIRAILEPAAV